MVKLWLAMIGLAALMSALFAISQEAAGVAMLAILSTFLVVSAGRAIRLARRDCRLQAGFCVECGYDLRGTPRKCPECGHEPEGAALSALAHRIRENAGRLAAGWSDARFGESAQAAVRLAVSEALRLGYRHVGTEHVLLGILAEGSGEGAKELRAWGIELDELREAVMVACPPERGWRVGDTGGLPATPGMLRAIERAGARGGPADSGALLVEVLRDPDSAAAELVEMVTADVGGEGAAVAEDAPR
jgi:hypothetical protein